MPMAYYNEIDPYAAEWLRNLIAAGHIAPGVVDTRSIEEVRPNELREFTQCHFFAGIGAWSYALRLAGWPDERPVWTGSCPCQPFSAAGKAGGFNDERHLWPAWHHLIGECLPSVVFGEQVASKDGLAWLDLVHTDMEAEGYAVGAFDLCAAGVGAPHIRQRLYFVADANLRQPKQPTWGGAGPTCAQSAGACRELAGRRHPSGLAQSGSHRAGNWLPKRGGHELCGALGNAHSHPAGRDARGACGAQAKINGSDARDDNRLRDASHSPSNPGPTNGHWGVADWLYCRDGKWRPVEPGTFPLAHGATSRVGRLRAYGNAIVSQVAAQFIESYLEVTETCQS